MKILIKLAAVIIVTILVFGSCTSQKELMYLSNLDTTSASEFFLMERPGYKVQYQDILYVDIFTMNPEMNELLNPGSQTSGYNTYRDESNIYVFGYTVSDSGNISIPILGDVRVIGLSLVEVKTNIEERAMQYLKDAVINVKLLSFKFTVIGEVNRPGSYTNFNNQLTVLDAIGMAGDISDYGNRKHVLVLRPTKEGTNTYHIDLQDKNLLQSEGYFLLPNDLVIVEPLKSKPIQLNIPTYSLIITTTLTTLSTLILLLNYLDTN
jgi:polysaccharide export outer membrane protein